MFGPSLKSVPGCLVSIVPILIGVPVALTPGLGPQDDVDALPPADALVEALQEQRIRAAVDVTDPEPLPAGHPLWSAPNCLITPHIGGSTPEFIYRAFRFGAQQVRRFIAGEPLENVVTDAGY